MRAFSNLRMIQVSDFRVIAANLSLNATGVLAAEITLIHSYVSFIPSTDR